MNYRHAFHAGNFADVVKHAVLVRILLYLARKDAPFRIIDTHAGAGVYDLGGDEATRTGEWRDGVARLPAIGRETPAGLLLAPYRALLTESGDAPLRYPGSPVIVQAMLRERDRALFCETQSDVRAILMRSLGRDARVKVLEVDGWTALGAFVPPPERRGLVLVDPPFEASDEFTRMADGFIAAHRKWPTGIFVLWYPTKSVAVRDAFVARLAASGIAKLLRVEFGIARVRADVGLTRAGLIIANPPYTLADELQVLLPALGDAMGRHGGASWSVAAVG